MLGRGIITSFVIKIVTSNLCSRFPANCPLGAPSEEGDGVGGGRGVEGEKGFHLSRTVFKIRKNINILKTLVCTY